MISNSHTDDREDRLNEILLNYVEACESGKVPDRNEILASYPDLHEDLALFFNERDRLERLGGLVRNQTHRDQLASAAREPVSAAEMETGRLGDFRLIREIGRGGMGIVYEAEQISMGRKVALKTLPFASALDHRHLQRFKNEAAAAAHLRHANIVSVYAFGCERGIYYYAMQFVEGQSLLGLTVELRQTKKQPATETTAQVAQLTTERRPEKVSHFDWVAGIGQQVALALEHAHQTGIIHRDVKPGNLLLDTQGQVLITDFGLALIAADGGLTLTGEMLGTLRYASPEQTLGRRGVVDHRSDVYSLGATLYELLTLRPPFDGSDRHELLRQISNEDPPTLRTINPEIPQQLETIVLKALRKEPADRYSSAQELADDLQRFIERRPILARPPGLSEYFWIWTRRHPASLMMCAITLLLMTISSILIAVLVGSEQENTRSEQQRTKEALRAARTRAQEAESRLGLARRAVDELLLISEEELADRPESLLLRKRILRSALTFYQEVLAERQDDPLEEAELLETTGYIEKILADLEILRSATHFYLLCQPSVLEDLKITDQQRAEIEPLIDRVGKEWIESFQDIGLTSPSVRAHRTLAQAIANDAQLNLLLNNTQQIRLHQIRLQSEGAAAFRDPEVAKTIGLTPQQREQIRVIEDDAAFGWMRGRNRSRSPDGNGSVQPQLHSQYERIQDVLTKDQIRKWKGLTGEPVKGPLFPFGKPMKVKPEPK